MALHQLQTILGTSPWLKAPAALEAMMMVSSLKSEGGVVAWNLSVVSIYVCIQS